MGSDINTAVMATDPMNARLARRAAVRIADQIAAEHPDERDELMPRLAGRELGKDPAVAAGVLELLDQLGLKPQQIRRRR